MKKSSGVILCVLLSISLLLASFSNVSAKAAGSSQVNPVFTLTSGDMSFTTEFLPMISLPGATTLASGMLIPVGFPSGEKQFEGVGLQVTGFDFGSASACFPITAVNQGWGGQVGKWDGSKWVLLPTSISKPTEESFNWACATVNASGTYALISWVVDASKLPTSNVKPQCDFTIIDAYETDTTYIHNGSDYQSGTFQKFFIRTSDTTLAGLPLTVSVSSNPTGTFTWDRTMSGTLVFNGSSGSDYYYYIPIVPHGHFYDDFIDMISRTYHLDFGTCTQDVTYGRE